MWYRYHGLRIVVHGIDICMGRFCVHIVGLDLVLGCSSRDCTLDRHRIRMGQLGHQGTQKDLAGGFDANVLVCDLTMVFVAMMFTLLSTRSCPQVLRLPVIREAHGIMRARCNDMQHYT